MYDWPFPFGSRYSFVSPSSSLPTTKGGKKRNEGRTKYRSEAKAEGCLPGNPLTHQTPMADAFWDPNTQGQGKTLHIEGQRLEGRRRKRATEESRTPPRLGGASARLTQTTQFEGGGMLRDRGGV